MVMSITMDSHICIVDEFRERGDFIREYFVFNG